MYHKTIISFAFILFLFSCGNSSKNVPLELNNGAKWNINSEMMPPLKASEKLITEFATTNKKDYKSLAEKLKENNKLLIASCTMKGKSHDELHKWLHPYMELVNELGDVETEGEANQVFQKIKQSFNSFNQYFQ